MASQETSAAGQEAPTATRGGLVPRRLFGVVMVGAAAVIGADGPTPNMEALAANANSGTEAGSTFRDRMQSGAEGPAMVVIPAGRFRMGRGDVVIAQPFALSAYETTRGEYSRFVAATGHSTDQPCDSYERWLWRWTFRRGGDWQDPGFEQTDTHPVVCVSWNDVRQYVKWLAAETGEPYRLPSEAEWEYAARAGANTNYSWGDEIGDNRANCGGHYCGDRWEATAPVGSFAPNAWGVYDMHGNVWEWVEDCWNDGYYGAPMNGSAWLQGDCMKRVMHGGSWYNSTSNLRAATRVWVRTDSPGSGSAGFRVARSLKP